MQRKFLCLTAVLAGVLLLNWRCTKLDSTILGEDLIPAVDNVTTFALDTLTVIASREQNVDTTKMQRTETHALGSINNDPVFGKTKADIFLQLKPSFYPFYFGKANDTINPAKNVNTHFDSVFLCLSYTTFYGDTTKPQHFKVYELNENTDNFSDTIAHPISFAPNPFPTNFIGEATVYQPDLKNYTFLKTTLKDSVTRQIRIKLNPSFLSAFTSGDSALAATDNSFYSDSLFKEKHKGFAVVADGGSTANGLFYVSLTDAATRLEVFYTAGNGGKLDTAFSSFPVSVGSGVTASATANRIVRDTTGAEFANNPDPSALYVQSAPGSAIRLSIPGLADLPNCIIHRAEIFLEQVPGSPGDDVLTAPSFMYLDLINDTSTANRYKPIYFDLAPNDIYYPDLSTSFFPTSGVDQGYYGGYLRTFTGDIGTRSYYTFNITRYLQSLVTKNVANYKFRVYAPYNLTYYNLNLQYKNNIAAGRIKINNGSDPKYRIRVHIIYSKI